ncbi:hypothetical protein SEUCBS139899_002855 [Sporothrix eucalyptigena]
MPPPLYDAMYIANALRNDALPALQHFADHPNYRERVLGRFERDDPPPYESSTESEEAAPLVATLGELPPDLQELFDRPLKDSERGTVAYSLYRFYYPLHRYREEEAPQRHAIYRWASAHPNPDIRRLLGPYGSGEKINSADRRCAVVARNLVKRRWQKLGVWNPAWGIPEPEWYTGAKSSSRSYGMDLWPWQHSELPHENESDLRNDPVQRAVELREGLRYGEHVPVQPRSHLTPSSSDTQGESFLITRPWFQLLLELHEHSERRSRLDVEVRRRLPVPTTVDSWKARGDWKDKWTDGDRVGLVGWKWRHESPSPEPEDLAGVENMAGLELTPSETDALESIPVLPPTPPPVYIPPDPNALVGLAGGSLFGSLFGGGPTPLAAPDAADGKEADEQDADGNAADEADDEQHSPHSRPRPASTRSRRGATTNARASQTGSEYRVTKPRALSKPTPKPRTKTVTAPQATLRRSARIAAMAANRLVPVQQPRARAGGTRQRKPPTAKKKASSSAGVTKRQSTSNRSRRARK